MSTPTTSDSISRSKVNKLNQDQRKFFDHIKRKLETDDGGEKQSLIFVSGGVGTGKSYLIQCIADLIKEYHPQHGAGSTSRTEIVQICSITGRTAQQIGGRTLHSLFPLPLSNGDWRNWSLIERSIGTAQERELQQMLWLIIDDVSVVSYNNLRIIHQTLQRLKSGSRPFGGVNVLLFGDLMQLQPVDGDYYCFKKLKEYESEIHLWREFKMYELRKNIRQSEDVEFTKLLDTLRFGRLDEKQQMLLLQREHVPLEGLFKDGGALRVFPKNELVDGYNQKMNKILRAEGHTLFRINAIDRRLIRGFPDGRPLAEPIKLQNHNHCGGLPTVIELGVGMKVMLTRRMPGEEGLENGVVGVIKDFIWSETSTQNCAGEMPQAVEIDFFDPALGLRTITPVRAVFPDPDVETGDIERYMLPVINLGWATTAYKLQGTSLESGVLDLSDIRDHRGHSILYVALGCVKTLQGLALPGINRNVFDLRPDVNVIAEMNRLREQSKLYI